MVGHNFGLLLKHKSISQKEVSARTGISAAQINKFINGKSDLSLQNFVTLLESVDVNINEIIKNKIADGHDVASDEDCMAFLFRKLDKIGKQTYLKNLSWAVSVSVKEKLPSKVQKFIQNSLKL